MTIIGIDAGTSMIKLVSANENGEILKKLILNKCSIIQALDTFIDKENIKKEDIKKIAITGVGTDKIQENIYGIETIKIDEFQATAKGGLYLANKKEALIVSAGTGTALVMANEKEYKHIGGTGVGGATLFNLCKKIAGVKKFEEIEKYMTEGNAKNIDLLIEDVTTNEIITLPKDITAANFGKLDENTTKEDLVFGIVNMVFEAIGMMAIFATQNTNIKDIILLGNITKLPDIKKILERLERLYNVNFIIPNKSEMGTVMGAVKLI